MKPTKFPNYAIHNFKTKLKTCEAYFYRSVAACGGGGRTLRRNDEARCKFESKHEKPSNVEQTVNTSIALQSRLSELLSLQKQFDSKVNIVSGERLLRHKGHVKVVSESTGKAKDKMVHLFNDMVLVSSEKLAIASSERYKTKYHFNLNHSKVRQNYIFPTKY